MIVIQIIAWVLVVGCVVGLVSCLIQAVMYFKAGKS